MLSSWFPNVNWDKALERTVETLYMTGISLISSLFLVLVLGLLLFLTLKGNLWENKLINSIIAAFVNIFPIDPFYYFNCIINSFYKSYSGNHDRKGMQLYQH